MTNTDRDARISEALTSAAQSLHDAETDLDGVQDLLGDDVDDDLRDAQSAVRQALRAVKSFGHAGRWTS